MHTKFHWAVICSSWDISNNVFKACRGKMAVICQHLTEKEKAALKHITKMACKPSKTELPSLLTTVSGRIMTKALRMVAGSSSPVLTLSHLDSTKYFEIESIITNTATGMQPPEYSTVYCSNFYIFYSYFLFLNFYNIYYFYNQMCNF